MFTLRRRENKVLNYHIKLNWKVILFFAIFWIVITLVICSFLLIGNVHNDQIHTPYIGGYDIDQKIDEGSNHLAASSTPFGLGNLLTLGLYGAPGITFFLIAMIVLNTNIFNKDISQGKLAFWMTLPVSRTQIFLTKLCFEFAMFLIMFVPGWIVIIGFGASSWDAHQYFGQVMLYSLFFIIFMFMMITLFALVQLFLVEKGSLGIFVNAMIIAYLMVTWILYLVYVISPEEQKGFHNVEYVSLWSLCCSPLRFSTSDEGKERVIGNITLTYFKHNKPNLGFEIASPFINIVLGSTCGWATWRFFNKHDFNI